MKNSMNNNESEIVIDPTPILKDIDIEKELIKALQNEVKDTIYNNDMYKDIRKRIEDHNKVLRPGYTFSE